MNFEDYLSENRVKSALEKHYGSTHDEKMFSKKVKEGSDTSKGHTGTPFGMA